MPRAKHVAVTILDYFATADLTAAEQLLYLCKQALAVRAQDARSAEAVRPKRRKRRTKAEMQASTVSVKAEAATRSIGPPPRSEATPLGTVPVRRPRVPRPPGVPSVATEPLDSV